VEVEPLDFLLLERVPLASLLEPLPLPVPDCAARVLLLLLLCVVVLVSPLFWHAARNATPKRQTVDVRMDLFIRV
jgi:hypothetical protein